MRWLRKSPPSNVLDDEPPELAFEPRVRALPAGKSLLVLGELQLARGNEGAAEAETLARQVLEAEPENPRALLLLAGATARQGRDPGSEGTGSRGQAAGSPVQLSRPMRLAGPCQLNRLFGGDSVHCYAWLPRIRTRTSPWDRWSETRR